MSDDVDDRVRDALASLDRQVPASYFETLAARALARLDEVPEDFVDEEVVTEDEVIGERDEHSGLQDIRELANKARLARRSSQPIQREDRIASSSAGWKAVALPDPARQAAAAHLPSHASSNAPVAASPEVASAGTPAAVPGHVIDELARQRARAAPVVAGAPRAGGKRRLVAIAGVAVAAAAGGVLVLSSSHGADEARMARPVVAVRAETPTTEAVHAGAPAAATPAPARPTPSAPAPRQAVIATSPLATRPDPVAANGVIDAKPIAKPTSKAVGKGKSAVKLGKLADPGPTIDPPEIGDVAPAKPVRKPTAQAQGSGEPSFDELVREAGIHDAAPAPPKLDRTSLSSDDVKRGLGAVTQQARACFTGTEGVATVRLTVAPSGKVTKVTTTGPFAGTPTAACVERAVKSATFPPWDGGPQSVGYSYLLSE